MAYKIALTCALLLCVILFLMGVGLCFAPAPFLYKAVVCPVCWLSATAFTALAIKLWEGL